MTNGMINKQHEAALKAGKQYAKEHGHSIFEEVAYGRGHKAGSIWYRNNIWHEATEVPVSNMELLVITEPYDAPCIMTSNSDRFRERAKQWAYVDDLLPDNK